MSDAIARERSCASFIGFRRSCHALANSIQGFFAAVLVSATFIEPAFPLNILITNDDGVEASSIHALYQVLKERGDHVIVVSETQDNSGKGGAADFFKPIGPLKADSRAGYIKIDAPGTGKLPGFDDVYYVDSTPYAATLFGIDVAARQAWRQDPDLVISGPNYGNNTGMLNNSSGTVNAALIAVNRGVPAIAVSAALPTKFKSFAMLQQGDPEYENARLIAHIVATLEQQRTKPNEKLMAYGIALNINLPVYAAGTAAGLPIVLSRESSESVGVPMFSEDLSQDAGAKKFGIVAPSLPGISISPSSLEVNPDSEQHVVASGAVAISVLRGNHEAGEKEVRRVNHQLQRLWQKNTGDHRHVPGEPR